jgi:two-component system OmpR family sensor kinase
MRNLRILALPLFLFLVSITLAGLFWQGIFPDPVLYLEADLGVLTVVVGLTLSLLVATSLTLQEWVERIRRRAQDQIEQLHHQAQDQMEQLRRRAQDQVEQVRRQTQEQAADDRRRFLGRLHHELKNPLTPIRIGLTRLTEIPDFEARREAKNSIDTQVLRLKSLAENLRYLAELETGSLEFTSVAVADLLEEVVKAAKEQPEAEDRHLILHPLPQAPRPLPSVSGNEELLFRAVYNLLSNALKFTQPGKRIEVRAFEDEGAVVIVVADTGPGIPEAEVPHVWEELYRGEDARSVEGSGLGLAFVRTIINRHNGQVALISRPGEGTEVRIELPVV